MMTTIVAIYTGQGLADPLKTLFKEHLPEVRLFNISDDSLIQHVIRDGKVTQSVALRLIQYYKIAVDIGADYILNTCSSVGEVADAARKLFDTPILKIDEPMAKEAAASYETVGVLATLPTTLKPTVNLLQSQAALMGKTLTVIEGLAKGAYQALIEKNPTRHDKLILEAAQELAGQVDAIVLAQGSMARMEKDLKEKTGIPVLSSPQLCIREIKSILAQGKLHP
ncbi:MAG: aspartate/glutamate racemase family protein [Deltaproteobacteria bacterium]|nr:aspartate/glutamate racemase family protein [Deltaproteobacteria bacterium]MBW1994344.1 aspartate/glutamate racemase family protein [Deltaproteobacteria bacterium]MBW2153572.1 aspartate/glutamate racemase family protein [Deltaproteobacteria bacterium]